jgi:ATP-dependent DNA helicase DinG
VTVESDLTLSERALEVLDTVTAALPGGGERREGQRTMTAAVADVLDQEGHLVVQAGTGTGKSLAYLIPIALSGRRSVIATATRALQDQLAGKDLPFLRDQLGTDLDFAVLKGRSNYLCRQRLDELDAEARLELEVIDDPLDEATVATLRRFADSSTTGDRADLRADVGDATWRLVSVGRDECPGAARCPRGDDCFAEQARYRASIADIVVVNLHLYALDVTTEGILPQHDLVVIDEAHQLEDIVSEAAGCSLTPGRCTALARVAGTVLAERELTDDLDEAGRELRDVLAELVGTRLTTGLDEETARVVELIRIRTDRLMQALRSVPEDRSPEVGVRVQRARQSATALLDDIERIRYPTDHDVTWVAGPPSSPSLRATPVRVDDLLAEGLWSSRSAILTSATLSAGLVDQLGLPPTTEMADVGSPFDFDSQGLLYCPTDLPDPRSPDAADARIDELEALIVAAGGRTLALFTSLSAMREAAGALESRLPWDILVQGQRSKAALLAEFTENDETSLFATISFWQGVDVPGSSCSLVVIDRLPFPRPDDPVLQARRERAGPSAFRTIDLPRAATMLAQGAGRLLRTSTDEGVVAVLDPRLATSRAYRWDLIRALPPFRRTKDREEVIAFLQRIRDLG